MRSWKSTKLGDIATYINGYPFTPADWGIEGLPIIRIQNLTNSSRVSNYYSGDIDEKYEVNNGDILISWSGSLGVFEWNRGPALVNQHIFKVVFDKEEVDKRFFRLVVEKSLRDMEKYLHGSTMKHITKGYFDNIEIPLPPIDTQRKIAAVLDKAQELIDLRKAQIEKLDDFLRSVFLDMFGDPVTNPKGWEVDRLDNVAEIVSGVAKGRKLVNQQTVFVPYMRVANVQDGHLVLDEIKQIEVLPSDVTKYALLDGDLLATEGGDPDKLGRCAVWKSQIKECIHQNHIFRIRLQTNKVIPEYVSFLMGSKHGKIYFLRSSKQTTGIASINSTQLKSFPAFLPPLPLQQQFAAIVEKTEQQKTLMQQSLTEMENNFSSLMQQAFRGELF